MNEFTGALCMVTVAIPVELSVVRVTNLLSSPLATAVEDSIRLVPEGAPKRPRRSRGLTVDDMVIRRPRYDEKKYFRCMFTGTIKVRVGDMWGT